MADSKGPDFPLRTPITDAPKFSKQLFKLSFAS